MKNIVKNLIAGMLVASFVTVSGSLAGKTDSATHQSAANSLSALESIADFDQSTSNSFFQNVVASSRLTDDQATSVLHGQENYAQNASSQSVIRPTQALKSAMSTSPGSQALGVKLVRGSRLLYVVRLKTGNQIRRILVDARTGSVIRQ